MQTFPETANESGTRLWRTLGVAGLAALLLGTVPSSTVNLANDSRPSGCNTSTTVGLTQTADPFDLAVQVFPCAEHVVVVPETASHERLQTAVVLAISHEAPLFISSPKTRTDILDVIDRLNAKVVAVPDDNSEQGSEKTINAAIRTPAADKTYVLPTRPTADQMALIPSLVASGINVVLAKPGNEDQANEIMKSPTVVFSPDFNPTDRWLLQRDQILPGGGFRLFPDRRIVALYGHPGAPVLGLLGEQGPQAASDRVSKMLPSYAEAGVPTIGGFEIISTIATAKPGDDGNYSKKIDVEQLRPWIETAVSQDLYVILDLQPGRTDFLTQAKLYEEFLKLPNVGLALDPEWRLLPDQVHLRQIGGVDAAEVNQVVDYLAQLVRDNNLPQKALVLHQFQTSMLRDRSTIETPPELAVVVHVDGQGPLGSKFRTWDSLRSDPIGSSQQLWWGWKNFIDEDLPTATPQQVNDVIPLPVVVTYQ